MRTLETVEDLECMTYCPPNLRAGNTALSYLDILYPRDAKVQTVINLLPKLSGELYNDAQEAARLLLHSHAPNLLARIGEGIAAAVSGASTKETALANSVFDLQLTVVFSEFADHFGDTDVAWLLVDALLYQATGFEADSPTNEQLLYAGTHDTRGAQKFCIARKIKPHLEDVEGWIFGKEFSAIVTGSPLDLAYITSVAPSSVEMRVHARWIIRYVLHGTLPTEKDHQVLKSLLATWHEKRRAMIASWQQGPDVNVKEKP